MSKPVSSIDAKRIIKLHSDLLKELTEAANLKTKLKDEVIAASNAMVSQEVMHILKDIPVEEVNRDKRGIRVKALREYGYNSIGDLVAASVYSLSSVYGISEDTAYHIKRVTRDIVETTQKNVKIKLSEDNKTPASNKLVIAISKYQNGMQYAKECDVLLKNASTNIKYGIEDLSPATSGIKWFFASKEKKQKAVEAFEMLGTLSKGSYYDSARKNLDALRIVEETTISEAWNDFSENSVRFFNILEDVNPGVLGTDDPVYGLPEELAREIQDQAFFPQGLCCELYGYQAWGVKYALHQERVLLGDEMGLGKTVQAIATMVSLKNTGATHFVVVCPASVLTNWCREIKKMSLLSVTKIHGTGRLAALKSWIKTGGVAVTTYETTGIFKLDNEFKFSMLVVDEAHYIKNPEAQRTKNVKLLSKHADRLLFMTGTALENHVDEMVTLINILQPKVAANIRGMEFMSSAPQFREKIAPVYYRRKRKEVQQQLPDLIEIKEWCTMTPEEENVYEDAVLGKHFTEARRVSWNVNDLKKSSKALRMMEIIKEAESEGRRVIVFSFFLDTIQKVTSLVGNKCFGPINGSVSPQRRQEIIDEFNKAPAGSVLAAQIQAGGTGLNIQSASVVILCEPQFKPSIENQAISRAYRVNQTRNVLAYRLLCENSVDERIMTILENKQAIFDAFADKSVAAIKSAEAEKAIEGKDVEVNEKTFANIIQEEIDRINAKRGDKK